MRPRVPRTPNRERGCLRRRMLTPDPDSPSCEHASRQSPVLQRFGAREKEKGDVDARVRHLDECAATSLREDSGQFM